MDQDEDPVPGVMVLFTDHSGAEFPVPTDESGSFSTVLSVSGTESFSVEIVDPPPGVFCGEGAVTVSSERERDLHIGCAALQGEWLVKWVTMENTCDSELPNPFVWGLTGTTAIEDGQLVLVLAFRDTGVWVRGPLTGREFTGNAAPEAGGYTSHVWWPDPSDGNPFRFSVTRFLSRVDLRGSGTEYVEVRAGGEYVCGSRSEVEMVTWPPGF